jgi:hypothetical protein
MAAREDEPEPIVGDLHVVLRRAVVEGAQVGLERGLASERLGLLGQAPAPSKPVDGAVAGGGRDPRPGVDRDAAIRPGLEGADEGVLDGLLGEVEVAGDPDQRGDRPALLLAEQAVDGVTGGVRPGKVRPGGGGRLDRDRPQFPAVAVAGEPARTAA